MARTRKPRVALARTMIVLVVGAVGVTTVDVADAQNYPDTSREIRHIVPWNAGSATDIAMRGFMRYLSQELGVTIFTDNIAGGISAIGLLHITRARPDGYTIGTMTYDVLTVEHFRLVPVSWTDFRILGLITSHPTAIVAPSARWVDFEAFRAEAASRPGRIKLGNAGTGGVWHQHALGMESELDLRFVHVPYSSSSAQLSAVLGGEVDAIAGSLPAVLPYVREGTLRVLAVMAPERDELLLDAPTFRELGYDVNYVSFRAVVAPKDIPDSVAVRLERAVHRAWLNPAFQEWATRAAIGAAWNDPEGTRNLLRTLAPRVQTLMRDILVD